MTTFFLRLSAYLNENQEEIASQKENVNVETSQISIQNETGYVRM